MEILVPRFAAWQRAAIASAAAAAFCSLLLFAGGAAAATPVAPVDEVPPPSAAPRAADWVHAFAAFGAPKYPRGFDHFEYVNPAAPKGGTLHLANPDRRTSFDKFNPFTVRGASPAGIEIFMFETLATLSADEPMTMYGLLAEEMFIAPDRSAITFRLNPKAKFSNGDPVTAQDVKYSYDTLTSEYASPNVQSDYAGVKQVVIVDDRTIRFELSVKSTVPMFKLGNLYIFSHKWGL
jgi:peptide/nickel transport system substrate-binding protein/microcin C transport system substrate-binding protein